LQLFSERHFMTISVCGLLQMFMTRSFVCLECNKDNKPTFPVACVI
jgi:hypothetical protein